MRTRRLAFAAVAACCLFPSAGRAQTASIPQLQSRPGAAYTLYVNFGGFNYTGTWGNSGLAPGVVPAYSTDANTASFSAAEITNMRSIWSRVAEKYTAFNVNVTTIDPAPVGSTDPQRQLYYESTTRVMQSIVGGSNAWYGGGGGVSYVDVAYNGGDPSGNGGVGAGYKTNWVFPANLSGGAAKTVAEATAHEIGHAMKLSHQSRWTGSTLTSEYDSGSGTGAGSFAPIMGNSYSAERGTWRVGATSGNSSATAQNDVTRLLTNNGIGALRNSGIGHTPATATPLPRVGSAVDSSAAAGFIAPLTGANPLGEANYTTDYFSLATYTGPMNIVLRSGRSTLTPGTADAGATLNATLRLLAADGVTVVATATAGVLTETLNIASLPEGNYFLQIVSAGGGTNNGYSYFDMGSYFLTGTYTPTPEPGFLLAAGALAAVALRRLRKRTRTAPTEDHSCPSKS